MRLLISAGLAVTEQTSGQYPGWPLALRRFRTPDRPDAPFEEEEPGLPANCRVHAEQFWRTRVDRSAYAFALSLGSSGRKALLEARCAMSSIWVLASMKLRMTFVAKAARS